MKSKALETSAFLIFEKQHIFASDMVIGVQKSETETEMEKVKNGEIVFKCSFSEEAL